MTAMLLVLIAGAIVLATVGLALVVHGALVRCPAGHTLVVSGRRLRLVSGRTLRIPLIEVADAIDTRPLAIELALDAPGGARSQLRAVFILQQAQPGPRLLYPLARSELERVATLALRAAVLAALARGERTPLHEAVRRELGDELRRMGLDCDQLSIV